MTFPVMFFTDLPIWYNVGVNVLAIITLLCIFLYAIFSDDIDSIEDIALFIAVGLCAGFLVAIFWGIILVAGIILGIIFGIILGLRHLRVKTMDWYYYRREC